MVFSLAIFDMDGLLIDSEPLWRAAEIEVFGTVGVALTDAMCIETTGLRIDEVVALHYRRAPWTGPDVDTIAARIVDRVIALVSERGSALPGVAHAIEVCRSAGLRVALASSSSDRLIAAVLRRMGLETTFEITRSAAHERYGKPHPAVFLTTAEALGVDPQACLVFEDSVRGVLAGKAASMTVFAVPEAHARHDPRFAIADRVLDSLLDLSSSMLTPLR